METLFIGSTGPYVMLIQSLLNRIGYHVGPVDGIFGLTTQQAILAFQRNNNLVPDGVVGPATWNLFEHFIKGYDTYTIKPGDTFYKIAQKYYTTVDAILTANPGINPNQLMIGQKIIIPYGIDVVPIDVNYTYWLMEKNIEGLKARYPFLEVGVAGTSVLGKNLYYIRLGTGPNHVFYNGAHHALEWITSPMLMKFIENFAKTYAKGGNMHGYYIPDIWKRSSIYIIPMVNPDGVDLVVEGLKPTNPYYNQLLQWNNTGLPFSQVWQANIKGVDLNLNYPAGWEIAKALEHQNGIFGPSPSGYGGPSPLSEPESSAVSNFTKQHLFSLVIAFHTQGKVIYWQYENMAPPIAYLIAQQFATINGYSIEVPAPSAAHAGYKDWFIQEYKKPGYTLEVGLGKNPLPISQLGPIYVENEGVLLLAAVTFAT